MKSCSFVSSSKREFNAHKLAHDGINAKRWLPYTCSQCPARFYSSDDQMRHAESQGSKQYVCPRCPESFYFKPGLEMHYEVAHANEPNPDIPIPFQCPHCKFVCKTPLGLEMHLRWRYMGACLAEISASAKQTASGADPVGGAGQQPSPTLGEDPHRPIVQPIATRLSIGCPSELSGNSTPVYAPVATPTSGSVSVPSSVAGADASNQASPRQTPDFGPASLGAKPSLNTLAAAVAANYQEMLSPTNSTDMVMGTYTPDDVQSKQMATSSGMIPLGYSSANMSFKNGVVTPLSNNSPSATPLSTVSSAYRETSTSSLSSPNPEELSPSSRLGVRSGGDKPNTFSCSDCMESFSSRELFNYHLRTAHFVPLSSERKFECKTCFKVCTTQSGLDYHNRTHLKSIEERRAYKCQECSQVFTVRSTLYRHQRTQHAATLDERKPYRCMYCGKAFASRYNLNRHADTRHPGLSREPLK